jgi:hypothetical protein
VLLKQLGRLGAIPLGFGELLFQGLLPCLDRAQDGRPGEALQDREQREEDDDGSSARASSPACSMSISRVPATACRTGRSGRQVMGRA